MAAPIPRRSEPRAWKRGDRVRVVRSSFVWASDQTGTVLGPANEYSGTYFTVQSDDRSLARFAAKPDQIELLHEALGGSL